ncbi:hypothetical protein CCR97_05890 [Rhodoplanes elegans]|uniref:DUF304 domain-containing protein n=1 Tax=Rhodoplanes elegans TaxID=29408 RepID=A0A327KP68_9BRAD|nr:hypothetical protein [Rhodoplanes elegans]MBK5957741.1 hypothetical protein [Rhodoplanes elegans]RAI40639.1 hypothetical protein CH338_05660 [Rhodoplanes elegans]
MPIEAHYSKPKLAVMAAVFGLFPILGIAALAMEIYLRTIGEETGPIDYELFLFVPILLLLTPLVVRYIRRIFDNAAVLSVDDSGLYDRRWLDRPIPWDKITWSGVSRIGVQSSIWLKLAVPVSDFTAGGSKRMLASLGAFTGVLVLNCTDLDVRAEEIQASIEGYLPPKPPP